MKEHKLVLSGLSRDWKGIAPVLGYIAEDGPLYFVIDEKVEDSFVIITNSELSLKSENISKYLRKIECKCPSLYVDCGNKQEITYENLKDFDTQPLSKYLDTAKDFSFKSMYVLSIYSIISYIKLINKGIKVKNFNSLLTEDLQEFCQNKDIKGVLSDAE